MPPDTGWKRARRLSTLSISMERWTDARFIRVKSKPSAKKRDCPWNLAVGYDLRMSVEAALNLGVSRVVVGTAAYENQEFLRALCKQFPDKIVVGIDARNGKVAVKGWKETTSMDAVELAKRCETDGASRIIYTDISRDGTREGVNLEETLKLARSVRIPVIASGGVATLEDIRRLLPLEADGVEGVIVGRALYNGSFSLKEATSLSLDQSLNWPLATISSEASTGKDREYACGARPPVSCP